MKITKPIVFLDCESTGLDTVKDRIITLAIVPINAPTVPSREYREFKFNPGVTMTPENIAIHGITNEMVKDWPRFETRAREVHAALTGCDLGGFNLQNFDIPIIWEELYRCGIEWDLNGVDIVDVGMIFKKKEPRDLTAAVKFYLGREHAGAHGAMADTLSTVDVFREQTWGRTHYGDIAAMDIPALAKYCAVDKDGNERVDLAGTVIRRKDGVLAFGTKRNKGVAIENDMGYASWILRSDFPTQTRKVLSSIVSEIERRREDRGQERLF
jgi:DNA polymerase III subunit epsilon